MCETDVSSDTAAASVDDSVVKTSSDAFRKAAEVLAEAHGCANKISSVGDAEQARSGMLLSIAQEWHFLACDLR